MHPFFEQYQSFILPHTKTLLESYRYWTGKDLIKTNGSDEEIARQLFEAPFAVLSGGAEDDQILNYGNLTTLGLWEMEWETLIKTPSRLTAEPMHREERAEFLKCVRENGYIDNYQGIRVSSTGKRFRILQATVWNLRGKDGAFVGQAATFENFECLQ